MLKKYHKNLLLLSFLFILLFILLSSFQMNFSEWTKKRASNCDFVTYNPQFQSTIIQYRYHIGCMKYTWTRHSSIFCYDEPEMCRYKQIDRSLFAPTCHEFRTARKQSSTSTVFCCIIHAILVTFRLFQCEHILAISKASLWYNDRHSVTMKQAHLSGVVSDSSLISYHQCSKCTLRIWHN